MNYTAENLTIDLSTIFNPDENSRQGRASFTIVVFLIGLMLVVATGLISFSGIGSHIFFSWDSATYVANAKEYIENGALLTLIASYTQSFGNLAYPLNFNLLPETALAYVDGQIRPLLMYMYTSLLFFTTAYGLSCTLGVGALIALVSGIATVLLTMPVTSPPINSVQFWWHSPYAISLVYLYAGLVVAFHLVGRLNTVGNLLSLASLILIAFWVIIGNAKGGMIMLFGAGLLWIPLATSSSSIKAFTWKSIAALLVPAILLVTALEYIRSLYAYTGNTLLFSGMQTSAVEPRAFLKALFPNLSLSAMKDASSIWLGSQLGYPLAVLALLGMILAIIRPPTNIARHIAITLVLMTPLFLIFAYGVALGTAMLPLFVIFAVFGFFGSLRWACECAPKISVSAKKVIGLLPLPFHDERRRRWMPLVTIALVTMCMVSIARHRQVVPSGFSYPPSHPPLIDFLSSEIRFRPGDVFRGRYLDMSIAQALSHLPQGSSLASGLIQTATERVVSFGNDLTIQGPRYYDVPVALEVNRMNTTASVLFHNFLLIEEGQIERVDFRTITHFDPRLFRLLGIKYVLSTRVLADESARTVPMLQLPAETSLYEIEPINAGQYSPTELALIPEWRAALEAIGSPAFDPGRLALAHDDWAGNVPLTAADKAEITRTTGGYRLTASSSATSLLVLPFEFSRCLKVKQVGGNARMGRVDFFLTGVVFDKKLDAEISFRFGPFENAGCRLSDAKDIQALGLNAATFSDFRKKYPNRFQLEGWY